MALTFPKSRPEIILTAYQSSQALLTNLYVYVDNVDATYKRALQAGATSISELKTQFYGDRNCSVKDAHGNIWGIATHVEDVSPEEMQRRMKEQSNQ